MVRTLRRARRVNVERQRLKTSAAKLRMPSERAIHRRSLSSVKYAAPLNEAQPVAWQKKEDGEKVTAIQRRALKYSRLQLSFARALLEARHALERLLLYQLSYRPAMEPK